MDGRIARLVQLRDDFTDCIGCGCLSLDRCRLANPMDSYGEEGPARAASASPEPARRAAQDSGETSSRRSASISGARPRTTRSMIHSTTPMPSRIAALK